MPDHVVDFYICITRISNFWMGVMSLGPPISNAPPLHGYHGSHCLCWRIAARNAAGIAPSHLLWLCFACRAAALLFVLVVPYCPAVTSPPLFQPTSRKERGGCNNEHLRFCLAVTPPCKGHPATRHAAYEPDPRHGGGGSARALAPRVRRGRMCPPPEFVY